MLFERGSNLLGGERGNLLFELFHMGHGPAFIHLGCQGGNEAAIVRTADLAGFWERHYAGVRKELMRKYPRHPWPEDGASATPPVYSPRGKR